MLNWSDNWYIECNKAWYIHAEMTNVLFEYDFVTQIATPLVKLPDIGDGFRRYSNLFKSNNKIFCLPDLAGSIVVYDLTSGSIDYIEVENKNDVRLSICNYIQLDKDCYILFSIGLQKYIIIDTKDNCIRNEIAINDTELYDAFVMFDNMIYAKSFSGSNFITIDLTCYEQNIYRIKDVSACNTLVYDGLHFWMTGVERVLYKWKFDEDVERYDLKEVIDICPNDSSAKDKWCFRRLFVYDNRIVGMPFYSDAIISLDKNGNDILAMKSYGKLGVFSVLFSPRLLILFIPVYVREGRYIGFCELKHNRQYEYDMCKNDIFEQNIKFDVNNILFLFNKEMIVESCWFDLNDYLFLNTSSNDLFENLCSE